jgi:hypothetical protein
VGLAGADRADEDGAGVDLAGEPITP